MRRSSIYKYLVTAVFLIAFFAQTFGKGFYIADYYANPSKYAKNCVNKAKPQLKCNGKCQLMKKIQEQEKKEQEQSEKNSAPKYENTLNDKTDFVSVENIPNVINTPLANLFRSYLYNDDHLNGVFRPPCREL